MKASRIAVPPAQKARARIMRQAQTEPERRLWFALRYRLPLEGSHFRRQVSIDRYVVDFCCHRAKLVVEVDGNQHGTDAARAHDAARTVVIEAEGYRVLRFSNEDIWRAIDSVLDTILAVVDERTSKDNSSEPPRA